MDSKTGLHWFIVTTGEGRTQGLYAADEDDARLQVQQMRAHQMAVLAEDLGRVSEWQSVHKCWHQTDRGQSLADGVASSALVESEYLGRWADDGGAA